MTTTGEWEIDLDALIEYHDTYKHELREDGGRCFECERLSADRFCPSCQPHNIDASEDEVDRLLNIRGPEGTE